MNLALVRKTLLAVGLGALLLAGPAAAAGGEQAPQLRIERWRPVTVAGAHFRAHERVHLVLHWRGGVKTRDVRASGSGRLTAVFADAALDRCTRWSITAVGSSDSRARLARRPLPECRPPRAVGGVQLGLHA